MGQINDVVVIALDRLTAREAYVGAAFMAGRWFAPTPGICPFRAARLGQARRSRRIFSTVEAYYEAVLKGASEYWRLIKKCQAG